MLIKLCFRNAVRSWKDYLIFFLTLALVTALMYAFHSLLFAPDMKQILASEFAVFLLIATALILLILAWLLQYMIRFMMRKRSREFASYLLLGMRHGQIARLFWLESLYLGAAALILGTLTGIFLQQFLSAGFYLLSGLPYRLHFSFNLKTAAFTVLCFLCAYLPGLFLHHRRFRKMNIAALLLEEKKSEQLSDRNLLPGILAFSAGLAYLFSFLISLADTKWNTPNIAGKLAALIIAVYLLYAGLASFLVFLIRTSPCGIHHGSRLFLLRQLSYRVKTMRFTNGSLTVLFTLALTGCFLAQMLYDYQKTELDYKYPFTVSTVSSDLTALRETSDLLSEQYPDTGCRISALRALLHLEPAALPEDAYLLHIQKRIWNELGAELSSLSIPVSDPNRPLAFSGAYTDGLSQEGHLGSDYIIVISDDLAEQMEIRHYAFSVTAKESDAKSVEKWMANHRPPAPSVLAFGSEQIAATHSLMHFSSIVPEFQTLFITLAMPLIYIGLVYLCVSLTVLSVQQLSDAENCRSRVKILSDLGLSQQEINRILFFQVMYFFLFPVLAAVLISGIACLVIGNRFFMLTGIGSPIRYFSYAMLFFLGIYLLYFMISYLLLCRQVLRNANNRQL